MFSPYPQCNLTSIRFQYMLSLVMNNDENTYNIIGYTNDDNNGSNK